MNHSFHKIETFKNLIDNIISTKIEVNQKLKFAA